MIISTANQKVKRILKLQKKAKARNEEHVFLVEGDPVDKRGSKGTPFGAVHFGNLLTKASGA